MKMKSRFNALISYCMPKLGLRTPVMKSLCLFSSG